MRSIGPPTSGTPALFGTAPGPKMVLTEATGRVETEVPRYRDGSFEPRIVKKRHRRRTGVELL